MGRVLEGKWGADLWAGSVFGWDAFLDSIFKCADAGDTPAPPKSGEIAPPAAAYWRNFFQCEGEKGGKGLQG